MDNGRHIPHGDSHIDMLDSVQDKCSTPQLCAIDRIPFMHTPVATYFASGVRDGTPLAKYQLEKCFKCEVGEVGQMNP